MVREERRFHHTSEVTHPSVTYPRPCEVVRKPVTDYLGRSGSHPLRESSGSANAVSITVTVVIYTPGGGGFQFSALGWKRLNTNQGSDPAWSFIKGRPLRRSRVAWSLLHPPEGWRSMGGGGGRVMSERLKKETDRNGRGSRLIISLQSSKAS